MMIHVDLAMTVCYCEVDTHTIELDVLPCGNFRSHNMLFGLRRQQPYTCMPVPDQGSEDDLPALVSDLGNAAGVGPCQLPAKPSLLQPPPAGGSVRLY